MFSLQLCHGARGMTRCDGWRIWLSEMARESRGWNCDNGSSILCVLKRIDDMWELSNYQSQLLISLISLETDI